jgi:hypothetical protein
LSFGEVITSSAAGVRKFRAEGRPMSARKAGEIVRAMTERAKSA